MATATLNISLSNISGSTGVKVYYKLHSSSTWIYDNIYSPSGTTATISGLNYNFVYNFQVQNFNGGTNPYSNIISTIGFSTPVPVLSPTNNSVGIVFPNLSSDITGYTLTIATSASPSVILQTISVTSPGSTITENFTGLSPATNYVISIVVTSTIYSSPSYVFPTATLASAGCSNPSSITATLSL